MRILFCERMYGTTMVSEIKRDQILIENRVFSYPPVGNRLRMFLHCFFHNRPRSIAPGLPGGLIDSGKSPPFMHSTRALQSDRQTEN